MFLFSLNYHYTNLDREKVTEQIITHWFQNKRKITRKCKKNIEIEAFKNNNSIQINLFCHFI
jgi:hypothetical protein